MSRDYEQLCHHCNEHRVRSEGFDDITLCQCLNCGKTWYINRKKNELTTTGISEKAWLQAHKEILNKTDLT